jgi:apolipoprotein N-acyltransferase
VTFIAETMMLSHGWRRFLMLAIAGAVAALSAPPLFLFPALFVTLPLWVWALDGAERRPGLGRLVGPAFQIGFAFGFGYFAAALHWLGAAFLQEGGLFIALLPFGVAGLAAVLALFWGLASAAAHLFWSHGAARIAVFAGSLALAEYARGHLFSGFPFDLLGYALTANDEMLQLASVIGVYGLTLVAALVAATPALIWPADGRGLVNRLVPFFLAVAAIAGQVGFGSYRLAAIELGERSDLRMRLVQLSESRLAPSDQGLGGISHLVWPESVFPFFLTQYPEALARIGRMLPEGALLLTGAPREPLGDDGLPIEDNPGFNSILAIDSAGEIVASYDKSHLVPFGEYLPFQTFFRQFGINQFVPGTNGWAAGDGRRLMAPPGSPAFLALICYEAVFPGDIGPVDDAGFILNITNDAWFMGSIGPAQHAHHARLRSVETGLPMLRSANTGTTLVIDALGRITARLAEEQVGVLDVVPGQKLGGGTIYNRLGDWPMLLAAALCLAAGMIGWRRGKRPA